MSMILESLVKRWSKLSALRKFAVYYIEYHHHKK